MKFTCDSCSAQYMIADEKIGARGVKVRCKKCSHVIILKPGGATAKKASESASGSGPSLPPTSLHPMDSGALSASESAFELPPTSSDMGLSAEFSAAGFEDTQSSLAMPKRPRSDPPPASRKRSSEPVRLPGAVTSLSPFDLAPAGGSLNDFNEEGPNTELSAFPEFGTPGLKADAGEQDDDPFSTTKVEPDPGAVAMAFGLAAPRRDSAVSQDAETRVAPVQLPPDALSAFSDETTSENDMPVEKPRRPSVDLPSFDFGRSVDLALDSVPPPPAAKAAQAFGIDESEATESQLAPPPSAPLAAAPAAAFDLVAGLGSSAGPDGWTPEDGLGDLDVGDFDLGSGRPGRATAKAPSRPVEAPIQHNESTAVGVVMADTQSSAQAALIASQMAGLTKEHLDAELGSALDAVFGEESLPNPQPSASGPDPFASLVASAQGALVSSDIAPQEDRKETRVFDNEAMARVQDEQSRAFGVRDPEPAAVKEWYVGIEEEQIGPITFAELQRHWDEARVDANALCWRQGMGDWTAIRFVDELASLLDRSQSKKPKAAERAAVVPFSGASSERAEAPMAARGFSSLGGGGLAASSTADAGDVSDWRPSAASALASLAAAELDAPKANDIQVGPVLPVKKGTGGSFESLIQPPTRSQSLFGIQEETSSSMSSVVTRAPELVSPVPLAPARARSSMPPWLPPTIAVLLGFVLLGGLILWKLSPGPTPSAAEAPPAAEIARAGLTPTPTPPPAPAEEPAPTPTPTEAAAPTPSEIAALNPAPSEPSEDSGLEADGTKSEKKKKGKKEKSGEGTSSSRKPKREKEPDFEPPPLPPPTRARSTADDLLDNAGSSRRSEAPEAPARETLGEADIFKVLKNNRSAILACVDKQRKADPALEGVMTVRFVIQGSGRTSGQSVEPSKFAGSVVGKCVISSVKKWDFPSFSGRSIPLDFPVKVTGG